MSPLPRLHLWRMYRPSLPSMPPIFPRRNAVSSPSCSATWWTPPRSPVSLIRKTCGRSSAPIRRPVRAGLGMVSAMQELQAHLAQRHGVRIAVRIGIHTGVVVVGDVGGGSRQEQLALGDTPNMAARLQGLAAPDTVVLSAATFSLVHGYFTYQDLGAHTLKGVATPMPVYRMLGESGVQSRLEAIVPGRLTPWEAREERERFFSSAGIRARPGRGQEGSLKAKPGLGKS